MKLKLLLFSVICLLVRYTIQAQELAPAFKKGERVVFVGNSITDGGHYHSYIWLYYMTRFPDMPITIMNAGIGGDCAKDIKERMDEDILNKKPTYLTLTFGMNDVGYYDFYKDNAQDLAEEKIKESFDNYKIIEKRLKENKNVTKVLIGGSPYDETSKIEQSIFPTKNAALLKVNDFQRAAAKENGWAFVDFARPMMDIDKREQQKDPNFNLEGGDRIHPDNNGHMVMAYLFLKGQGLNGKKVAEVDIDIKGKKTNTTDNCDVSDLTITKESVNFTYLAKALPYPTDTVARGWGSKKSQDDALKLIPFIEEFNQEILKINGLSKGTYQLKIDDIEIAKFTNQELNNGVNLATLKNTPQYQQASLIMLLNEERWEIERKTRTFAWMRFSFLQDKGVSIEDTQAALDTISAHWDDGFVRGNYGVYEKAQHPEIRNIWQKQQDDLVKTIYSVNKPIARSIELVKIKK